MPQKENPTANGNRVLWNALDGASTETHALSSSRAQHLIGSYGIRPCVAPMVSAHAFGGSRLVPNPSGKSEAVLRLTDMGRAVL